MSFEQIIKDETPNRYGDEDYKILYEHIKDKKPSSILLEIGCGVSTLIIGLALKEITEGREPNNQQFISVDTDKPKIDDFVKKLENLKISNVQIIHQDSISFINSNCNRETIKFIFLDSSHTFEQTMLELNFLIPILMKDGYLFMHDTKMSSVLSAIYLILTNNPNLTFYEYNTYHGLGLLRWKQPV